jgi:Cft2 family RNA processing exonuclease
MPWDVQLRQGLHLPQIDWWLDAPRPTARSFVSHAHFDHMARHRLTLCTESTARLMYARQPARRELLALPFDRPHELTPGCRITLLPAGHILGSAQFLAESEHGRLLYSGDFKLRPGRAAEVCATPRADVLIMETTFGLPKYKLPPPEEVIAGIVRFCRETLAAHAIPVLFGYSLGKAQELLASLAGAELPIMLHPEILRLTQVCEKLGLTFPAYRAFDALAAPGHVVIAPPQSSKAWLGRLAPRRTAMATGWALDSSTKYQMGVDAAFPLSDHADFPELLEYVERVQPRRVLTVHGFAAEFAQTLRARGIDAWALGKENQLEFGLGG